MIDGLKSECVESGHWIIEGRTCMKMPDKTWNIYRHGEREHEGLKNYEAVRKLIAKEINGEE